MTSKNSYAVLTAVLFTIGFVTIDNAHAAEEVSFDQAINLLDQYEAEIKNNKSFSAQNVDDANALKRIELTKELVTYDKYRDQIPEKYNTDAIDNKISEILKAIQTDYSSGVIIEAEVEIAPDYFAYGYGTDWSHNPTGWNCSIQANSNGDHDGEQYSVSSSSLKMWNDYYYPSTYSDGSIPCPSEDFERSYTGILSYKSPFPTCTSNIYDYNNVRALMTCNGHNFDNSLALVTTDAHYDDGSTFDEEWSLILP